MSYENDLPHEFAQHKERMHRLKATDAHFRGLWERYEDLNKEIHRIENGVETPDDTYVETCKKRRLELKDKIFRIISKAA